MRYNKIYEKCVLSLFEKFFLVTVAAAAQEAEHVEVSSSDKPNPKSLLMSGRPPAWRPPPSVYECVCERVNVSVVKVLWAIRRLERCRAKCMNLPYSSPHFSDKIIAYFTGAILSLASMRRETFGVRIQITLSARRSDALDVNIHPSLCFLSAEKNKNKPMKMKSDISHGPGEL